MERHLDSCCTCRDELDRLAGDQQFLRTAEVVTAPPYLRTRVMAEIRSLAASRQTSPGIWGRVLTTALSVVIIIGSAWAGVVLGGGLARFGRWPNETGLRWPTREAVEQRLLNPPGQEKP